MSRQELCFGKKQETKSKNRRSTRSLKMKKHEHIVKSLMPGGIGEELGSREISCLPSTEMRYRMYLTIITMKRVNSFCF